MVLIVDVCKLFKGVFLILLVLVVVVRFKICVLIEERFLLFLLFVLILNLFMFRLMSWDGLMLVGIWWFCCIMCVILRFVIFVVEKVI